MSDKPAPCRRCAHHDHAGIEAQSACVHCDMGSKFQDPAEGYPSGTVDDLERYPATIGEQMDMVLRKAVTMPAMEENEALHVAEALREAWDNVTVEAPTHDGVRVVASDIDKPGSRLVCLVYVEED
jgi:predicted trehalose synthase